MIFGDVIARKVRKLFYKIIFLWLGIKESIGIISFARGKAKGTAIWENILNLEFLGNFRRIWKILRKLGERKRILLKFLVKYYKSLNNTDEILDRKIFTKL